MGGNYNVYAAGKIGYLNKYQLIPSSRAAIALAGFCGSIVLYLMRANLSVAIVCMTLDEEKNISSTVISPETFQDNDSWLYGKWGSSISDQHGTYIIDHCPGEGGGDNGSRKQTGEFYWNREMRGMINSSFYWGYILTQVIGGALASKFSTKWILGSGMLVLTIASILSPPAAHISPYVLMLMRFLAGIGSGAFYPCFHQIWARWAPPNERSFLLNFVLSGNCWGSVISYALSGVLCADLGWEWVFWIYAICGVLWMFGWAFFAYDPPESHPRISQKELDYIKISKLADEKDTSEQKMKIPWIKVLTSPCVLCVYFAQFCSSWGLNITSTSLPQYMKDVLKINIKQNGFYNSLPHLFKFLTTIGFALIADFVIARKYLSVKVTRKIMQTIGFVLPSILMMIVAYLDCFSPGLVVTCLILSEGFTAGTRSGATTNILDLAPRFAGLLMGVGNTIANFAGIFAPIVAGVLTTNGTQEEWRSVIFVGVGMHMAGFLFYIIFSAGEVQPWAIPPENNRNNNIMKDDHNIHKVFNTELPQTEKKGDGTALPI